MTCQERYQAFAGVSEFNGNITQLAHEQIWAGNCKTKANISSPDKTGKVSVIKTMQRGPTL